MLYNNIWCLRIGFPDMAKASQSPQGVWHFADRLGAMASFLCAIHCALLPFVLTLLPLLGLCMLALTSLIGGYRRHRRPLPLSLALPGLTLLVSGVTFAVDISIVLHSVMVTCGGLMVASAHFVNLRLDRHFCRVHGVQHAH